MMPQVPEGEESKSGLAVQPFNRDIVGRQPYTICRQPYTADRQPYSVGRQPYSRAIEGRSAMRIYYVDLLSGLVG